MKRFPYTIYRVAGLPATVVEALRPVPDAQSQVMKAAYQQVEAERLQLNDWLYKIGQQLTNYQLRKHLSAIRNDIYNRRNFHYNHLPTLANNATEASKIETIKQRLAQYEHYRKNWKAKAPVFEQWYQEQLKDAYAYLQKTAGGEEFQKGLLLSSLSIADRVTAYQQKPISTHRKKERQTARTLLQYLSRISLKLSPFSRFTQLSVEGADSAIRKWPSAGQTRLNNHLLAYLQELLLQYPPFYRQLKLRINPSIREEKEQWVFLLNARNVESVQRMDKDGLPAYLRDLLMSKAGGQRFYELLTELQTVVEASEMELEAYLIQLLQVGFLEWHWGISGLDPSWEGKLIQLLESYKEDTILNELLELLKKLQEKTNAFSDMSYHERRETIKMTWQQLNSFTERFSEMTKAAYPDADDDTSNSVFQRFSGGQFPFSQERIFYEDCYLKMATNIPTVAYEDLQKRQAALIEAVLPLSRHPIREELWTFFKTTFPNGGRMAIPELYEAFFRQRPKALTVQLELEQQAKSILQQLEPDEAGNLNIHEAILHQLAKLTAAQFPDEQRPKSNHFGAVWQLYKKGDTLKAFVDASILGYGKLSARFLNLFPKSVYEAQLDWNQQARKEDDYLWIENTDGSYFNANLHPQLSELEIWSPGSQNRLSSEQQISITDLEIRYDPPDQLRLFHLPSNREVRIMDLGLEALLGRSPMYQLLSAFGPVSPNHDVLNKLLNEIFQEITEEAIVRHPQIQLGADMVLQRRCWYFPKNQLPLIQAGESVSLYFLRLQQWRIRQGIPARIFIRLHARNIRMDGLDLSLLDSLKTDDYKPQYIDLESPIYVQLWNSLLKKVPVMLKIEEMLPLPEDLLEWEGSGRCLEAVVQWTRG